MISMGVMDATRNILRLRILEDLVMVGYDDAEMISWGNDNLISVHQPMNEIVKAIRHQWDGEGKKYRLRG